MGTKYHRWVDTEHWQTDNRRQKLHKHRGVIIPWPRCRVSVAGMHIGCRRPNVDDRGREDEQMARTKRMRIKRNNQTCNQPERAAVHMRCTKHDEWMGAACLPCCMGGQHINGRVLGAVGRYLRRTNRIYESWTGDYCRELCGEILRSCRIRM